MSGRGRLLTATSVSRDGYSLWSGSWFLIAVSRSKRHENHARQTHQEADSNKACHYYARSCILFSSAFTANMDGRKRGEFNSASVYCISNNKQNTVVSRREKAHFIKGQQSYSKRHQEHSNIGAYGIPRIMLYFRENSIQSPVIMQPTEAIITTIKPIVEILPITFYPSFCMPLGSGPLTHRKNRQPLLRLQWI